MWLSETETHVRVAQLKRMKSIRNPCTGLGLLVCDKTVGRRNHSAVDTRTGPGNILNVDKAARCDRQTDTQQ